MDYVTIADQLLAKNIVKSRQSANATQNIAMSWLNDPRFNDRTEKFVLRKKRLLPGLDIPFRADRNFTNDIIKKLPALSPRALLVEHLPNPVFI